MANNYYADLISRFPTEADNFDRFIDPTPSDLSAINKFYSFQSAGNLDEANKVLADNPRLKKMIVNADTLNKFLDGLKATQRYFFELRDNGIIRDILGCVKFMNTYDKNKAYTIFNVVDYMVDGAVQTYFAIEANIPVGTPPTDTSYWKVLTLRGKQGAPGLGLSPMGLWDISQEYVQHNLVAYNNMLWSATRTNIGKIPSTNSVDWYLVFDFSMFVHYGTNQDVDDILNGTYTEDADPEVASLTDIEKVVDKLLN